MPTTAPTPINGPRVVSTLCALAALVCLLSACDLAWRVRSGAERVTFSHPSFSKGTRSSFKRCPQLLDREHCWRTACHSLMFFMFSPCLCARCSDSGRLHLPTSLQWCKLKWLILWLGQPCALERISDFVIPPPFIYLLFLFGSLCLSVEPIIMPKGFGGIVSCPWTLYFSFSQ